MKKLSIALAVLTVGCLAAVASAKPESAIRCPVQGLSDKQRLDLGAALVDDGGNVAVRVQDALARIAAGCARTSRWTAAQTEAATSWGLWDLMVIELERRSGLSATDLAVLHAYVDEDPTRIDGMDRFTDAQVRRLIEALRQRGAHVHDMGGDTVRELAPLMTLREMKKQESAFAAG